MRALHRVAMGTLGSLGLLLSGGLLEACAIAGPRYQGPVTPHFDGARFHNQQPIEEHGLPDMIRWARTREPGPWQKVNPAPPGPPPPTRVGEGNLRVTFVNHATLLVQMDGLNILTDPHWSERASPVSFAGPKRVRPPGLRFEDLPRIHVVLLSHNHYDHLDLPTLRRLAERDQPLIVTGLGNDLLLEQAGIPGAQTLDWWAHLDLPGDVRVTGVPAQHFSARGLSDRNRTLWMGFVLEGRGGPVYFAGDTGWGPHFEQIRRRFGPLRLAMLPIGAYRPQWFMKPVHISPSEAWLAHRLLEATRSVAMHFGTFPLADDGQWEPFRALEHILARAEAEGLEPGFWVLGFGEGRDVPGPTPGS